VTEVVVLPIGTYSTRAYLFARDRTIFASRAPVSEAGNSRESAIGPEGRWRSGASDVEARQQARGQQVANSFDAIEPRPRRMLLDRAAQLGRGGILVVERTRVGALENSWSSRRLPALDCLQKIIRVAGGLGERRRRSPLKNRAQALSVRNARSLRILEQSVEQSELRRVRRLVRWRLNFVEGDRHALGSKWSD
jgi:hypothetical protein